MKALPAPKVRENSNTEPQNGTIYVDSKGNAVVTPSGGNITGSPDGRFIQARDADGNVTGVRIDGPHSPKTHKDPSALEPHGHVPDGFNGFRAPTPQECEILNICGFVSDQNNLSVSSEDSSREDQQSYREHRREHSERTAEAQEALNSISHETITITAEVCYDFFGLQGDYQDSYWDYLSWLNPIGTAHANMGFEHPFCRTSGIGGGLGGGGYTGKVTVRATWSGGWFGNFFKSSLKVTKGLGKPDLFTGKLRWKKQELHLKGTAPSNKSFLNSKADAQPALNETMQGQGTILKVIGSENRFYFHYQ